MFLRYFFAWFGMVIIAIANGTLRQYGYAPFVGELPGHQISTFTLVLFFFLYFWSVSRKWPMRTLRDSWIIGGMWFTLTIAFEFGFGHYIAGHPWIKLLHDYNLFEGRLWSFVLATILVGPDIIFRWQNRLKDRASK